MEMEGPATPDSGIDVVNRRVNRGSRRKRLTMELPTFDPNSDAVVIPPKRMGQSQRIADDVTGFLAKIRPASNKKTAEPTAPYSINTMLNKEPDDILQ